MYLPTVLYLFLSLAASLALASPQPDASSTTSAPAPQSTACGDIIDAANTGVNVFLAKDVYDCLISVPFDPVVATRFVRYCNDTLQFHSTLSYLKNPPTSYQQPAVDLVAGLDQIQRDIDGGVYRSEYAFEATLQNLLYSAHDSHLQLYAGIFAAFTFGSPYELASVSLDGVQNPKVYISDDLLEIQDTGAIWQPSAIATINGQGVEDYLSQFAAVNAFGYLEPNAEWNQLMYSPALDIQDYSSIFGGFTTFYPGENLTFKFENGTELYQVPWLAFYLYDGPTGPLTTGGDFYNFFVLGFYPDSFNATLSATASGSAPISSATLNATPTPSAWTNTAYPQKPDVVQPNLSADGGVLTGYFFNDTLIGVLSIPSFEIDNSAVGSFQSTVSEFLRRSNEAGMEKIVIDVQQNAGGDALLAFDTFEQFFPNVSPFGGSRLRAQPVADALGNTVTNLYNTPGTNLYENDIQSLYEWLATDKLDAETGQDFISWGQFYSPHSDRGDYFTTTQRYNLSSPIFNTFASADILISDYNDHLATSHPVYASEDIVILTDALCSSACAIFMEMMHHEAGVRTVVVGGQPHNGPMQAPSGSRGARYYTSYDIDYSINFTESNNSTTIGVLPTRENDVLVTLLGVNLRDQVRKGENIPLQFVYEAANCRIFYTPQTIYNYTNLWHYAADAMWTEPNLCVHGSTGYATSDTTNTNPGGFLNINPDILYNISGVIRVSGDAGEFNAEGLGVPSGIPDAPGPRITVAAPQHKLTKYDKNISSDYQKRTVTISIGCKSSSPHCGGTKLGPFDPKQNSPPKKSPTKRDLMADGSLGDITWPGITQLA